MKERIAVLTVGYQKMLVSPSSLAAIDGLIPLKAAYNGPDGKGYRFHIDEEAEIRLEFFDGSRLITDNQPPAEAPSWVEAELERARLHDEEHG